MVKKQTLWGYQFGRKEIFLKVYSALPPLVPTLRRILSNSGVYLNGRWITFASYESNLPFILRFMIDRHINGGGWIKCNSNSYRIVAASNQTSFCSFEVVTRWDSLEGISHLEMDLIAPLRVLSFDIECSCNEGFPDANRRKDQVIQIANIIKVQGYSSSGRVTCMFNRFFFVFVCALCVLACVFFAIFFFLLVCD